MEKGSKLKTPEEELTSKARREMLLEDVNRIRSELESIRAKYSHPYDITEEDSARLNGLSAELESTLQQIGLYARNVNRER